jgi:hypothetical protein
MLNEFAFTPSVFDETCHQDIAKLCEQLRQIGNLLSSSSENGRPPIVIADLYSGSWYEKTQQCIMSNKDSTVKGLSRDILAMLHDLKKKRPRVLTHSPQLDSRQWGKEAIASHKDEAIDKIVFCEKIYEELGTNHENVFKLGSPGISKGISSQKMVRFSLTSQLKVLRKFCIHSEFVIVRTPYLLADGPEIKFLKGFIKMFQKECKFRNVKGEICILTAPKDEFPPDKVAMTMDNSEKATLKVLNTFQLSQVDVSVFFGKKFLNRFLSFGDFVSQGDDRPPVRKNKWLIAVDHTAGTDREEKEKHSWFNLLQKKSDIRATYDEWFPKDSSAVTTIKFDYCHKKREFVKVTPE